MINSIILVIPVLLLITAVEWYISHKRNDHNYTTENYVMNLAIGAMDQLASLVYFAALFFALQFVYTHFKIFSWNSSGWLVWLSAYVAVDFLSYWYHRFSHRINILWAGHVTHHSSEHFNFSNGFRTSFFQGVNRILFWSILPVFGFEPVMLVIILKVSGLYDFLLHTTYVPKLGFLEKIFITPSHHRVHHGRNDVYIDKNYGSTFVIWDKMFGTFREETEPVEYGIKGAYADNHPVNAIGYYYRYIWRAMQQVPLLRSKIKILFLPPERTPKVVFDPGPHPREAAPKVPSALRYHALFQVCCVVPALIAVLLFIHYLSLSEILIYGFAGLASLISSSKILNGNIRENFVAAETTRIAVSAFIIFLLSLFRPAVYQFAIGFFFLVSLVMFYALQKVNDNSSSRRNQFR